MSNIAELIESVSELKFTTIKQQETIANLFKIIEEQEIDIRTLYNRINRLEANISDIKRKIQ